MNMYSYIRILLVPISAALLVACGGSGSDETTAKAKPKPLDPIENFEVSEAADGTKSIVGRPVRATAESIVVANADGDELELGVRAKDATSVDVGHVSSHIGIQDLAFRMYYEDVDGKLYALASEEVSSTEL